MGRYRYILCAAAMTSAAAMAPPAAGYSSGSLATDACHEEMSFRALRTLRNDVVLATPTVEPTADERALLEDLPFATPEDLVDVEAASLVLSNRDVDTDGVETGDLTRVAVVQADPAMQIQNCLRRVEDDEPEGGRDALSACRAFIRSKVQSALPGLRAVDGAPDPNNRISVKVVLNFRGSVWVELPRFWVEMGRALHTLQDAFSHTYRVADDQRLVVTVMNFVDFANGRGVEERDGPPHASPLDECADLDAWRAERLELAEAASYELLRATLEPAASSDLRLNRVDVVLDRYMTFAEGTSCTADNGWCDAPERRYEGCQCAQGQYGDSTRGRWASLCALLLFVGRRTRARRVALSCFILAEGFALPAGAAEADRKSSADQWRPRDETSEGSRFGAAIAAGGALTNGAFALSMGGRYRASRRFLAGVDAELNPWFSLTVGEVRSGATNVYLSGILRFPMGDEPFALRSTLQLGITRMNFPLYGIPEGSIGPFVGFALLGLDYKLSRCLYLVLDPAHIAIPVPQLEPAPFTYMQYRVTVGLQYGG